MNADVEIGVVAYARWQKHLDIRQRKKMAPCGPLIGVRRLPTQSRMKTPPQNASSIGSERHECVQ